MDKPGQNHLSRKRKRDMTFLSFLYSTVTPSQHEGCKAVCWRCAYLCVCVCLSFPCFFFDWGRSLGKSLGIWSSWHIGAVLCSLLCVLGNMAALCCPARPWRQLPVDFRCSEVCVCRRVCLFSLDADFCSISSTKTFACWMSFEEVDTFLAGCAAVWVTTTWWWITTRNNAA